MTEQVAVDVLVAGGGVGGLMAGYQAHRLGARVMILGGSGGASSRISSLVTALRQYDKDTPASLFDDMFRAGGYVNNPRLLAALTDRIGVETTELLAAGVPFHLRDGAPARRQTTGCTWPSSVYSLGMIGVDISRNLLARMQQAEHPPLHLRGAVLAEIFVRDQRVVGGLVYSPRERQWVTVTASALVLATGGAGQLFGTTTNPRGSKGTGYALALEAGCELIDMEFVSFEPFITTTPGESKRHDLPTTVLKQGAKLRNGLGDEFLDTANAPTKDVICRAMITEVAEGRGTPNGSIYYDIREMDQNVVSQYVQIGQAQRSSSDPQRGLLEVMPAQHYLMGGARIDDHAETTVPGIFAVGEVAGGAHGGHRLAGAGGMEVVAGGAIAGENAARFAFDHSVRTAVSIAEPRPELLGLEQPAAHSKQLRIVAEALNHGCGVFRHGSELAESTKAIRSVLERSQSDPRQAHLLRSARVALSIAECANRRKESRGDHFRTDYPLRDDSHWLGNQAVKLTEDGQLVTRYDSLGRLTDTERTYAAL